MLTHMQLGTHSNWRLSQHCLKSPNPTEQLLCVGHWQHFCAIRKCTVLLLPLLTPQPSHLSPREEKWYLQKSSLLSQRPQSRQKWGEHRELSGGQVYSPRSKLALSPATWSSLLHGLSRIPVSLPICLSHPSSLQFSAMNLLETWTELPPITQPASVQIPGINAVNGGEAGSLRPPVWLAQHWLPSTAKALYPSPSFPLHVDRPLIPFTHVPGKTEQVLYPQRPFLLETQLNEDIHVCA
jgi:hypothetical protein